MFNVLEEIGLMLRDEDIVLRYLLVGEDTASNFRNQLNELGIKYEILYMDNKWIWEINENTQLILVRVFSKEDKILLDLLCSANAKIKQDNGEISYGRE